MKNLKLDEKMKSKFNIEISNDDILETNLVTIDDEQKDKNYNLILDEDFNFVRNTLKEAIEENKKVIESAAIMASGSEVPIALSVMAQLISQQGDTAKKLMDIHKIRKDILKQDIQKSPKKVITNNILNTTTTTDLLKNLK
jgi:hypothetical protein